MCHKVKNRDFYKYRKMVILQCTCKALRKIRPGKMPTVITNVLLNQKVFSNAMLRNLDRSLQSEETMIYF